MPKTISLTQSVDGDRENDTGSCEVCGKVFENSIELTDFSSMPMQTYRACPFCFRKVDKEETLKEFDEIVPVEPLTLKGNKKVPQEQDHKETESSGDAGCPHYLGYLKKRPKNAPIPDICLTCRNMVKCVL